MRTLLNHRLFLVWLALSTITVMYLVIDHTADGHGPAASTEVTVSAVALASMKVRIIMREFMEVQAAPRWLRRLTDLVVVVMAASLLGVYLVGKSVA